MPSGSFTPTPANRAQALADARKMLPVWEASGALFPSIYMSDAPAPEATRQFRVNATTEIGVAAAVMVAGGKGKKRIPVYPFAWECCECSIVLAAPASASRVRLTCVGRGADHNGSTLLTHEDAVIDMLSPYNAGADGLVVWGYTGGNDGITAQGGPQMQHYFDYIKTSTGPLLSAFGKQVSECSGQHCSGHGRCLSVSPAPTEPSGGGGGGGCVCFDGYSGAACEQSV